MAKKKRYLFVIGILILLAAAGGIVFWRGAEKKQIKKEDAVTSSRLQEAVNISELSTAEFVYNGIAEKYREGEQKKTEGYILYQASVKAGIQMKDVDFKIDKKKKTVTPVLPKLSIRVTAIEEESLSYIPKNPELTLKEIITVCKDDAVNEAGSSEQLYEIAQENLKSVIEALLMPILDHNGYTIVWEKEEQKEA